MKRTTRLLLMIVIAITGSLRSASALPNPVGWWKFDEGSGSTSADSTGNGNSGTVGGSWIGNGMSSNAMTYTTSQYTTVPYWPGFDLSNSITLSLWIKPSGPGLPGPSFSTVVEKDSGYGNGFDLLYDSGFGLQFQMTGMNGNSIASASHIPTNLWTHVAATFDGSTAKLYINGLLDRFATWSGSRLFTTNGIQIGGLPGAVDDVRIYSNALTEIQIAQLFLEQDQDLDRLVDANETILGTNPNNPDSDGDGYPDGMEVALGTDPLNSSSHPDLTNGLVCWWKFDEGSGTLTADSSTNGNDVTLSGGPAWISGVHSNALWFDGANSYGYSATSGSNAFAVTNFTLSFWAFVTNAVQNSVILDRFDGLTGYQVQWGYSYDRVSSFFQNSPVVPVDLTEIASNTWYHFAFTYDGATIIAYLNGHEVDRDTCTNSVGIGTRGLTVAQAISTVFRFQGALDDVRVYNKALTPSGVLALTLVSTCNNGLPDIQKSRLGLDPNAASTTGDGIPDDWAVRYGLNPLDSSVAAQTSASPFTHGLSNLQVYQNQSVLISDGYSTLGDGIADWWKVTYGFSLTDTNVASADPERDGLSNLQKYQDGLNPFVAYVVTVPPIVLANSSGNTASVPDAGAGASYSWSIDNGTIDSGSGTTNVSWSAGDGGVATLTVQLTISGGSFTPSGSANISPCVAAANIMVPGSVMPGSTNNMASLPDPFTALYSFTNGVDGANPVGITQGTGVYSNFYGAAGAGGTNGDGTLFTITPDGATLSNVWQFNNYVDGSGPLVPVQGSTALGTTNRYFYGVTVGGGPGSNGTVYAITPGGALTNLHSFTGSTNGSYPVGLTQGRDGNFYGLTEFGGSNNYGVFFMISSNINSVTFNILYHFAGGSKGSYPTSALLQGFGSDTFFYGTTLNGGTSSACSGGCGTVFKISPSGTLTNLHSFNHTDGQWPEAGLVLGSDTNFYGTTFTGGSNDAGTVFRITSQGAFTNFYNFGDPNGRGPDGGLLKGFDGNFYGTTVDGGVTNRTAWGTTGYGTVFRLTPQGTLTTLHQFTGTDGGLPFGAGLTSGFTVAKTNGYLFGVAEVGGTSTNCDIGCGTVFQVNPATYTWSIPAGGTITSGQGTPHITWTAGTAGSATIMVTITASPVCTNTVSVSVPIGAFNEWYGPFPSWTNITDFGVVCDGVTPANYLAVSNALAAIGNGSCSPVLLIPGMCLVTNKPWLYNRERVCVVGLNRDTCGFKYNGPLDSSRSGPSSCFHVDECDNCYFARLTFDGNHKSESVLACSQQSNGSIFDNNNFFEDCVFKNSVAGGQGIDGGKFGFGFSNEEFLRCLIQSNSTGVLVENNGSFNSIDIWFTDCLIESNTTYGIDVDEGSSHANHCFFQHNGIDFFHKPGAVFSSLVSNTSYQSGVFMQTDGDSTYTTALLLKGNTVIDPAQVPFQMNQYGPVFLIDNTLLTTNATIQFTDTLADLLAVGNTNGISSWATYGSASIRSNLVDNYVVARGSLTFALPGVPVQATNLNRTIVEIATNQSASSFNASIASAADGTVFHIRSPVSDPFHQAYFINSTITIPASKDVRIVGDGFDTALFWEGSSGGTMFACPHPSHATFSHIGMIGSYGAAQNLVGVTGVGSTTARVYVRDGWGSEPFGANIFMGDCPNTLVEVTGLSFGGGNDGAGPPSPANGDSLVLSGGGRLIYINTDGGGNAISVVCTNGGQLYVENSYNEASQTLSNRILSVANGSTITWIGSKTVENIANTGTLQGENFNFATQKGFYATNFTGQLALMGIQVIDWLNIAAGTTGNIWIEGANVFSNTATAWPIHNTTGDTPVQTMNWHEFGGQPTVRINDSGTASSTFVKQMLSQVRTFYEDRTPMVRRTNQTDVLIEQVHFDRGVNGLGVTP